MSILDQLAQLWARQSIPLVLSLLVILPFLTHYLTTTLFHRRANSPAHAKTPPTIPYWLPGVYHALGLLSKPSTYFALLLKRYGSFAPFFVGVGVRFYLVVRQPAHVRRVLLASDQLTTAPHDMGFYEAVLGAPKEAVEACRGGAASAEERSKIDYAKGSLPRKYLTGPALTSLVDVYISTFRRSMSNKMIQVGTWTQIEDTWSLFEIDLTRATIETLFGSALLKQYPKIVRDFWEFQRKSEDYLPGLPRFTVSASFAARDRLLEGIKKWLQATHGGTAFAKKTDEDPVWDADRGSKFVQERDEVLANIPAFNYHARAVEMLALMQSMCSNTVPVTIWSVIETLRKPTLARYLAAEIAPRCDTKSGSYDLSAISEVPIIRSLYAEVRRLRTATHVMRTNEANSFKLDENWTIPKGACVAIFANHIGMSTELWTEARPQTVTRPLEEFWAERFLIPQTTTSARMKRNHQDRIVTGTYSLAGLESLYVLPDGGSELGAEQTLALALQSSTLAVLLAEYEVQLCDLEDLEAALPSLREIAFGTIKPLDKIAIRLRKRSTSNGTA